jgi:hypothetical protein
MFTIEFKIGDDHWIAKLMANVCMYKDIYAYWLHYMNPWWQFRWKCPSVTFWLMHNFQYWHEWSSGRLHSPWNIKISWNPNKVGKYFFILSFWIIYYFIYNLFNDALSI